MPIGTSDGQYYEDEFQQVASEMGVDTSKSAPTKVMVTKETPIIKEPDFSWVDQGNLDIPSDEARNVAAQRVAGNVKANPDTNLHTAVKAIAEMPVEVVGDAKKFTDIMTGLRPGEEIPDEAIKYATKTAFNLLTFGLATAPFKQGLGLFGGRMTKESVALADRLESQGLGPTTIKEMTGLEKGADKMWRLEIDDSKARIHKLANIELKSGQETTFRLEELLKHDELFKRYPEFRDLNVTVKNTELRTGISRGGATESAGYFDPVTGEIVLNARVMARLPAEDRLKTLIHELQHVLQFAEGFPVGVYSKLPTEVKDRMFRETLQTKYPEFWKGYQADLKLAKETKDPIIRKQRLENAQANLDKIAPYAEYDSYFKVASEAEAKNVENRLGMTAKERKQIPGYITEDFPRSQQFVYKDNYNTETAQFGVAKPVKPYSREEVVSSAAIKTRDGKIHTGSSHFEIVQKLTDEELAGAIDGFISNADRFLSREQALHIAKHQKQIPKDTASQRVGALMSEDLEGLQAMK